MVTPLFGSNQVFITSFFLLVTRTFNNFEEAQLAADTQASALKPEYIRNETEVFDFIIIGGGSAGAVVTNRLSKNGKFKVLLLEAGGTPNPISEVPYLQPQLLRTVMDYQYLTVPQVGSSLSMVDQKVLWPRGKALGGTSNINNMMYVRGNAKDFDHIGELAGDPGWSYNGVLPYFKKSEDYHGNYKLGKVHGRGNELYVGKLGYEPKSKEYFFETLKEKNYTDEDLNAHQPFIGFMSADVTIKRGRRWGTYQAFLEKILGRKNLSIYRYSTAQKIHFDVNNKAIGVTYVRHGKTHYVKARKEIIVSCGSVDSPKLLMLSGIGPKDHLTSLGIQSIADLPVGQNLQDHIATSVGPILLNQSLSFLKDRDFTPGIVLDYKTRGRGPLSSTQLRIAIGYSTSSEEAQSSGKPSDPWPDQYYIVSGRGIETGYGASVSKEIGGKPGIFESYFDPYVGRDSNVVGVILARPKSRGEIKLASSNPMDHPIIDPKCLGDPGGSDIARLTEACKFIVDFHETSKAYGKFGAQLAPTPFPGCESQPFKSLAYWGCYVRHYTKILYHPVGTCSMGKGLNDPKAVVDNHLKVLKTKGLRVIDASILPAHINGNTNAASIMVGEKGSDLILQDYMS